METTNNTTIKILVGIIVVALAGVGVWQMNKDESNEVPLPNPTASTTDGLGSEVPALTDTTPSSTQTIPKPAEPKPTTPTQPVPTPTQPAPTQPVTSYKNGTYTVDGMYRSPEGSEKLGVTLTLNNDIVTGASITIKATDGTSKRYQRNFQGGFSTKVIGKNIDSLSLDIVNGASLTTDGFNDAVEKIQNQAKV